MDENNHLFESMAKLCKKLPGSLSSQEDTTLQLHHILKFATGANSIPPTGFSKQISVEFFTPKDKIFQLIMNKHDIDENNHFFESMAKLCKKLPGSVSSESPRKGEEENGRNLDEEIFQLIKNKHDMDENNHLFESMAKLCKKLPGSLSSEEKDTTLQLHHILKFATGANSIPPLQLNMDSQIISVCKSAYYMIYNLRRIRKYFNQDSMKTVVHACITSKIA